MLMPSIGFWLMPSTSRRALDAGDFENCRHDINNVVELRANPAHVLDVAGQEMAMPCLVPPKYDATCLVHLNGVSKAHDHATDMCGVVWSEPRTS
jgi:hypothetical protein